MKNFFTVLILFLAFEIQGWNLINEHVTPLIAGSQNFGQVIYRDYKRENSLKTFQAIITEGSGTGGLYVPEKIRDAKGLFKNENGYEILNVSGKKAILESQAYMPLALAINVDDNITLTIESRSLNKNEIINLAEEVLSQWKVIK